MPKFIIIGCYVVYLLLTEELKDKRMDGRTQNVAQGRCLSYKQEPKTLNIMHNTGFLNGFEARLNFLNIKRIPSMEIITLNNYVIGRYSQLSHIDLLITVGIAI